MNVSIEELKNRVRGVKDGFELSRLRGEITAFMESPEFQQLPQGDRNRVEDLLIQAIAKEEQYEGCDPLRSIFGR